jgi:hypothetical protein
VSRRRPLNGSAARAAQRSTLLITNLGKIVGILGGAVEMATPPVQDSVLMFCAVLVIGAEALERVLVAAIRNLLGQDESS